MRATHRHAGLRARAGGARGADVPDRRARLLVAPAGARHGLLPAGARQSPRRGGPVRGARLPAWWGPRPTRSCCSARRPAAAAAIPWWVLGDAARFARRDRRPDDRARLDAFVGVDGGRARGGSRVTGVEELIERVLERTGYDLQVLAMPGGQRRLANIRKLMRLGREHVAVARPRPARVPRPGGAALGGRGRPDPDQSEAPVESEALDAVRLMTIHRAKGLEFEIVCVADLGRAPRWRSELLQGRPRRTARAAARAAGDRRARAGAGATRSSARSRRETRGR